MEEAKEKNLTEKLKTNPWAVSTIIFGILLLITLYFSFNSGITGNVVSEKEIGKLTQDFVKNAYGVNLEIVSAEEKDETYVIHCKLDNEALVLETTKDFSFLRLPTGMWVKTDELEEQEETQEQQTPQTQEITKSDKPKIELFVMTHCPYGTQAEKGITPVLKLLSEKIDGKIRFVHYFMHGDEEEKETYTQVCIREEQKEKYLAYLECFLEAGNSAGCLTKTGVDKTKLNSCLTSKAKEYYKQDSELSESYGVQGSPTLVINGVQADSERSSSAFLTIICSSFNNKPEECNNQLSGENPSPGFGYSTTAGATDATC